VLKSIYYDDGSKPVQVCVKVVTNKSDSGATFAAELRDTEHCVHHTAIGWVVAVLEEDKQNKIHIRMSSTWCAYKLLYVQEAFHIWDNLSSMDS